MGNPFPVFIILVKKSKLLAKAETHKAPRIESEHVDLIIFL
jgi:hypothetical protein